MGQPHPTTQVMYVWAKSWVKQSYKNRKSGTRDFMVLGLQDLEGGLFKWLITAPGA